MTFASIRKKYGTRIVSWLEELRKAATNEGMEADGPWVLDECTWVLTFTTPEGEVDVDFGILQSEECDGEENGVSFSINVVAKGGRILGQCTPFNYTDKCWVSRSDPEKIEERFKLLEQTDFGAWLG
jgi:hypothetical protein